MKRFARVATLCVAGTLCGGAAARAQTTQTTQTTTAPGPSSTEPRLYVEIHAGPTLGHKSDKFVGAEAGLRLVEGLDVFVEGGHMGNVGTSTLDDRAAIIAGGLSSLLGANVSVSSTAFVANYFNAGVRYHLSMVPMAHPYVLLGAGVASVKTEVTFAVNGTPVDLAPLVTLGGDLSGTNTKTMIIAGGGVNVPFMQRFFADLGYRYGHILAKTSAVATDKGIKTQRVVLGVGVRF
jgi:opacity protein-like surface antigen